MAVVSNLAVPIPRIGLKDSTFEMTISSSLPSEVIADSTFVCECEEMVRSACVGEPFYDEYEGKRYCVLHFPGKEKGAAFNKALNRKIDANDFNFGGVWFPDDLNFNNFTFRAEAYFGSATFNERAYFRSATFSAGASFHNATFNERASFYNATFRAAASFNYAAFNAEASFVSATFSAEAGFKYAVFNNYVKFAGGETGWGFSDQSSLNLEYARIDKPDHISFHTLTLLPHWFVNVDARKFDFTNVEWRGGLKHRQIKQEIENLKKKHISSPHRLLAIACRQLAVNAEENHRYEEASKFRYWAMDARRRESRFGFAPWKLGWWYWAASGYGERVFRAFLVLLGVWLLFAWLYTQPNTNRLSVQPTIGFAHQPRASNEAAISPDETIEPLEFMDALTYSAGVMTLQKPEPRPVTRPARGLFLLETILGPLQAALLALAIRRKFMR